MDELSKLLDEDYAPLIKTTQETRLTPFPQANSLERVLQIVCAVTAFGVEQEAFIRLGIVNNARQADYYVNAAIYLGLVKKVGDRYFPTGVGARLKMATGTRQLEMLAAVTLSHPTVAEVYACIFIFDTVEERKQAILSMVDMGPNVLAEATLMRRADCVYAWLAWIQRHLPRL